MSDSLKINALRLSVAAVAANASAPVSAPTALGLPNAPMARPTNVGVAATLPALTPPKTKASPHLRILTLNIQLDAMYGKNVPGIVDIIRKSRADVVGMQEVGDNGPEIARQLGFNYVKVGDDTAVISRYPLTAPEAGKHIVTITKPDGRKVQFLDLHLAYKPYQPFQLLKIPYEGERFLDSEKDAIAEAWQTRGEHVTGSIKELAAAKADIPQIVVGDFNQVSCLDWTKRTTAIGRTPVPFCSPETKAFADAGFTDSYRALFPDEVKKPGNTWTPTTSPDDPTDHHDRIDYVFYNGRLIPVTAEIVGEDLQNADIAVDNYATDHRGVVIEFSDSQ